MNKNNSLVVAAFLIIAVSSLLYAGNSKKIADFKLTDYNGKEVQLSDFKNSKAIVVMFIATQCPVSNAYNERMAKLYNDYNGKGISFIGINSNKQEDVAEIKKHSQQHKFGFPVLKDLNNVIADKFEATVTPEVYVVNGNMELLYHGRIDDNRNSEKVEVKDLSVALDEILAGKPVGSQKTKAFGCTIKKIN